MATKRTPPRVVLFTFAGRQPNLELQIPLACRILEENPNTEYHIWNFARNNSDRAYIKTIEGERITVWNGTAKDGFASPIPTAVEGAQQFGAGEHNAAYRHYSQPQFKNTLFVKIDDDIVFLETARFAKFVEAIAANPGAALLANIINNGACTPVQPGIWEGFQELRIPLLDIHESRNFADMVHTHFLDNYTEILNQPIELIPSEDWTSINAVGYTHEVLCHVIERIGTPQPPYLAGRSMHGWGKVFGDEGVFQTLPRIICKGFTAAHLTFGPQNPTPKQIAGWRNDYRELGERYLHTKMSTKDDSKGLPELSEVSCGYRGIRLPPGQLEYNPPSWRERWATKHIDPSTGNDPRVGRYMP